MTCPLGPPTERLRLTEHFKLGFGLLNASEAHIAAEDNHGFKERRRVLAPADGDPDGLEHGAGLEAERRGGLAQSFVQRIVVEGGRGQNLLRGLEARRQRHRRIALLRDQLGGIVGRELIEKEEVRGADGIAQQLDALANQRRDGKKFFGRGMKAGLLKKWLEVCG